MQICGVGRCFKGVQDIALFERGGWAEDGGVEDFFCGIGAAEGEAHAAVFALEGCDGCAEVEMCVFAFSHHRVDVVLRAAVDG